jgi:hypothetical protein
MVDCSMGSRKIAYLSLERRLAGGSLDPGRPTGLTVIEQQFSDLMSNSPAEESGPQCFNPLTVDTEV